MALSDYETLLHCKITLNQTALGWTAPLLTADFGAGYGAGAVAAPYGLHRWTLQANILPRSEDYQVDYSIGADSFTDNNFDYFFKFFKRHQMAGRRPFVIKDADTNKRYLVSFTDPSINFERFAYQLYSGGVTVEERRARDLLFNDDGSIFDAQTPYVILFIPDPISDTVIRIYMDAGDASGITGYDLEFTTDSTADPDAPPGVGWTVLLNDAAPVDSYDHTGLEGAKRYYYRFRARDEDENVSGWVTGNALTYPTPDTTKPVMTSFDAQAQVVITEIKLFFAATDNQTLVANLRYDLQWSIDGANWTNILTKQTATSPVTHSGRLPSTEYFYRMRAWDEANNFSDWLTASATTLADEVPPTINTFSASGGVGQITLSATFADNIGVTGVDLQWAEDAAGSTGWFYLLNNAPPTTATTLSYTHQPLADATRRYYRLRVRDAAGNVTGFSTANAQTTGGSTPSGGATFADGAGATWQDGTPITYA